MNTQNTIPTLSAEKLEAMATKAMQEKQDTKSNIIAFPKPFVAGGALGGLALAASIALVISVYQTPQGDVDTFAEVTDLLFYETLEDLSL